ncbi:hypothetical protein CAPTEDRAFT_175747 [Capitella teleta]|uniref:Major facilitator superfamily (MFS) profile domain-containing protein n=1 Tax=Capitella teleta TaxID=283909 RepID=R7U3K5_CAPTE|nr:hypothetical protein CAPTEDRAFT_175747 [Capitella teleta]|eukprot:ELU00716.1 hypothetical protein CAPTEDRAFT_175747 [Capitella teleta]
MPTHYTITGVNDPTAANRGRGIPHIIASDNPIQQSTSFVYLLTFLSAIGGLLFGYDTGVISGAMILLRDQFHLTTFWQELVVSVTIATAAIFAFLGGFLTEKFGRRPIIVVSSFVFTIGAIVLGTAYNREMLLIGRGIVGMGIGLSSMAIPMYIAENAPCHLRGRLVTMNNIFITGGQLIASLIDGAFSYDKINGWRYMLGLAGVPAAIQFVAFIFMPESARWLVGKGRISQAGEVLKKIRGTENIDHELEEIRSSYAEAHACTSEAEGSSSTFVRALKTPHVRRALIVGCGLQLFQQICGINTVMYYSATIIKMSGVKDASLAIWLSSLTAGVNFIFTFVGLYLVERMGRRRLTLFSVVGVTISLAVLAIGFQITAIRSPRVTFDEGMNSTSYDCDRFSTCDGCVSSPDCGFCFLPSSSGPMNASCVTSLHSDTGNPVSSFAESGRCALNSTSQTDWAYDYCPSSMAWMSTFGLVLYLAFFAPGMGPMPWTINSEIYPLWARSTGNSLSTATNWIANLVVSMTFLSLLEALTKYGAFWLYSVLSLLGTIFFFALLPETRGLSLEHMEALFMKPWC